MNPNLLITEWKNERLKEFQERYDMDNQEETTNENTDNNTNPETIEISQELKNEIDKVLKKHNIDYSLLKIS